MIQPEPRAFPFSEPIRLDTDPVHRQLREQAGMARVRLPYGKPAWLAVRYEDVKTVLSDPRFSRAQIIGPDEPRPTPFIQEPGTILAMDPPEHTRLRQVVARAFTMRRIEQLRPRIQEIADNLLDEVDKHGAPADLVRLFAAPLPVAVICELLGVPFADRVHFHAWSEALVSTSTMTLDEIMQAYGELKAYLAGLVAQRRQQPEDDLLSTLAHARDVEDRLSEHEMVGLALAVLVAGHEATLNQISNFTYMLLTEPDIAQQLRTQSELMPQAIEELMRYVPLGAGAGIARVATEDIEVGGVMVRAGEAVVPVAESANRDESMFDNTYEIDFTRQDNGHLTFGHGVHRCLGAQLARVELQVAIGSLLRRFPHLRLAVPADEVPWKRGMVMRGPERMPVAW